MAFTGVYKPRIRCYEVDQLSMKFERHLDAEVVAMECISQGFDKVSSNLLINRSRPCRSMLLVQHRSGTA